ncbi:hypothetical protein [Dactylosporangium sp. CA-092794]|uniref:hypothetical protein n=1 Tax=Dactylosporangium sp. CA-092794 TaxID=3239929 RepID=UPI003D8A584C
MSDLLSNRAEAPEPLHRPVDHAEHTALKARLVRLEQLCGLGQAQPGEEGPHLPAWLRPTAGEHRLPVTIALLIILGLQLSIPSELAFPPKFVLPSLELLLYAVLTVANPRRINRESRLARVAGLLLVLAASLATAYSAGRLVYRLATGHGGTDAVALLLQGGAIWLTNIIVFALWYWEFDRGGPAARANARRVRPDFLFTQMTSPELADRDWEPGIVDYLYLSFTNATAFSPTDTLPLSRWAKLAMMFQSGVSLVTVALVVARAVNIFQ